MPNPEQQRLLRTLKDGIETGKTADAGGVVRSPVKDFTCPNLLAQEQRTFFRETPLLMGLSSDLPMAGSYWADSETGLPILMTRSEDGEFHAFANVCRHRGMQVVPDGRGEQVRFSCPYHAWTYGNTGELIAVNRESSFGAVDKASRGLVELPSAEYAGMLWVKPTPREEIDVASQLGGLGDDMQQWDLADHPYGASQVIRADINWKLAIDTFGENYHFDVLHRNSLTSEFHGNLQTHDVFGLNYRMVFARRRFMEILDEVGESDAWPFRRMTLSVYFIYPNVILLVDPSAVDVLRMFPDGDDPGKSRTAHSFYVVPEAREYYEENPDGYAERFAAFNHVVENEDYWVAASVQANAASGVQTHILFGRNEPGLHHYHNAHRRGLSRPLLQLEPA